MNPQDIVVLGAGLAGLGFARTLPGSRVFEAEDHPGGHAWSKPFAGTHYDQGAHICHAKDPEWLKLVYQAAGEVSQMERSTVKNYWRGHFFSYPVQNHLNELPLDIRIQALTDLVKAQVEYKGCEPQDYAQWCLYNYGHHLSDQFYRVFTEKYWRKPMEALGTDWLAGRLLPTQLDNILAGALAPQDEKQAVFRLFHYPKQGGFFRFFEALYQDVPISYQKRAVRIRASQKRVEFEDGSSCDFETLVSSMPLDKLVAIVDDAPKAVREAVKHLEHLVLICINYLVKSADLRPFDWMYIYDHEIEPSRVSVPSRLSSSAPGTDVASLQAEIFRRPDEPFNPQQLLDDTLVRLGPLLGYSPTRDVVDAEPVIVPYSYVVSTKARKAAVGVIHNWLAEVGIMPIGLYGQWKYMWSQDAYATGVEAANELMRGV